MPKQHQRYGLGNYGSCVIFGANFDVISELDEIRTLISSISNHGQAADYHSQTWI